jgi:hypothetical protein
MPSAANVGAASASSFIAGAGALTGPAAPLTIGTAAAAATGDFAPAAKGVTNGDSHDHSGGDGAQIAYANLSGLPTLGKILQAVHNTSSSEVDVTTDTWTATGLSASITPSASSSKILVLVTQPIGVYGGSATVVHGASTRLLRGASVLQTNKYSAIVGADPNFYTVVSYAYIDSPNTTSAITYSVQCKPLDPTYCSVYIYPNDMPGNIVLLEIRA